MMMMMMMIVIMITMCSERSRLQMTKSKTPNESNPDACHGLSANAYSGTSDKEQVLE